MLLPRTTAALVSVCMCGEGGVLATQHVQMSRIDKLTLSLPNCARSAKLVLSSRVCIGGKHASLYLKEPEGSITGTRPHSRPSEGFPAAPRSEHPPAQTAGFVHPPPWSCAAFIFTSQSRLKDHAGGNQPSISGLKKGFNFNCSCEAVGPPAPPPSFVYFKKTDVFVEFALIPCLMLGMFTSRLFYQQRNFQVVSK